jgi:hypothetical protein
MARRFSSLFASALAFGACALAAGAAHAATDCTTLPNPVYVVGSTAIGPVVAKISAFLASQSTNPITVVYGGTGSCAGVATAVNTIANPGMAVVTTPNLKSNFFKYADSAGNAQTCDILPADGGAPVFANIALSDVFPESCQLLPNGLPLGITEQLGPVQAMTFVVPYNSTESAISAQAAYMVFGFGNASTLTPWDNVMHIFQRGPTSGTQVMLATGIKVPAAQWYGVITAGTGGMITALTMANTAMDPKAIGVLGATDVDPLRRAGSPAVKELAYRHYGQNCGYLPDSSAGTYDKRNVRNGHYAVWGPLHVLTLPASDMTLKTNIDLIVAYLTGTTQAGGLDIIASEAQSGLIPQCAMRVARTKEVGPMTPFSPAQACGCYYEYIGSPSHQTSCQSCSNDTQCPSNYTCPLYNGMGWCEAP